MKSRHLDDAGWCQAERIAADLYRAGCDHNELRKIVGMVRAGLGVQDVLTLQDLRLKHARELARSGSTSSYWRAVREATRPLAQLDTDTAELVLGWAVRMLMAKPRL